MVKVLFGWKDAPTRSAQECEDHYRSHHMGLARQAYTGVDGFRLLVYNRVRRARVNDYNSPESRQVEPPMDAFIELYFDSMEQLQASLGQPILQEMFEDHGNFMNVNVPSNVVIYEVDEEVILRGAPEA
jgi:uncharacterized protein (TIGR02118 family)